MNEQIISKKLIELRKQKGLTQIELSEQINYSDKVISKWERGESLPSVEALKILADYYKISIDSIISEDDDVYTETENAQLEVVMTKGPSKLMYYSIFIPVILFVIAIIQFFDTPSMLIIYSLVFFLVYLIVWSIIIVYVIYEASYKCHNIKFINKPLSARLYIDDKLVDENNSLLTLGYKLTGKIGKKTIKANISANASIKCNMFVE